PRAGDADNRDAIGRTDARLDERFGRMPRDLLVAGRDVGLIEDQDVAMTSGSAAGARDFCGNRAKRRFGIAPRGLVDVLEEQNWPRGIVFDDLEFVGTQIPDRAAGGVSDPDVEADELRSRFENRLRPALSLVEGPAPRRQG